MARLHVRRGGDTLRVLPLEMRQLSIGRTPDNGLPLRDPAVAVRHAEIGLEDGVLVLTDLGGGDSYLNGRRLSPHQPQRLSDGDEVQIGPFTVTFLAGETAPELGVRGQGRAPLDVSTLVWHPAAPDRPTFPAPVPPPSAEPLYFQFLPGIFQESEFLSRYLKIFEAVWEPLQGRQDHMELYLDARLAPPPMLPWLSTWLGVPLDARWPESRQRAWVREAVTLYRWRGTRYGLTRALETAFGLTPVLREDRAAPHTLEVVLLDPDELVGDLTHLGGQGEALTRETVREFVYRHAPAHVRCEVTFVPRPAEAATPPPGTEDPAA